MNTERLYRGDCTTRNNTKMLAVVGVCLGIGLLVFATPAGLPALAGPAIGGLWPVAAILCLILGVIGLAGGFDYRWRRDEEATASDAYVNTNQVPPEGIEAKLRQLLRLKEQRLITEEEYDRKRTEVLEKW
jgi:hypothetical protein